LRPISRRKLKKLRQRRKKALKHRDLDLDAEEDEDDEEGDGDYSSEEAYLDDVNAENEDEPLENLQVDNLGLGIAV
jgi:hypothetical protein